MIAALMNSICIERRHCRSNGLSHERRQGSVIKVTRLPKRDPGHTASLLSGATRGQFHLNRDTGGFLGRQTIAATPSVIPANRARWSTKTQMAVTLINIRQALRWRAPKSECESRSPSPGQFACGTGETHSLKKCLIPYRFLIPRDAGPNLDGIFD